MVHSAMVEVHFSAGHRLMNHSGKCRYPHGHSYRVELLLGADSLDRLDWIVDFSDVKARAKSVLSETFDHAFLVDSRDTGLIRALETVDPVRMYVFDEKAPTVERIAEELYGLLRPSIESLNAVRVWETDRQFGEFSPARSG